MIHSLKELIDVFYKGQLYHPSISHYPDDVGEFTTVICDSCKRDDVAVCKGYNDLDMCICCWKMVDVMLHNKYTMSNSYYNMFQESDNIFNKYDNLFT